MGPLIGYNKFWPILKSATDLRIGVCEMSWLRGKWAAIKHYDYKHGDATEMLKMIVIISLFFLILLGVLLLVMYFARKRQEEEDDRRLSLQLLEEGRMTPISTGPNLPGKSKESKSFFGFRSKAKEHGTTLYPPPFSVDDDEGDADDEFDGSKQGDQQQGRTKLLSQSDGSVRSLSSQSQ